MTAAKPVSGRIVRHDLMSPDQKGAVRFYTELFGWRTTEIKVMGFTVVRLTHGEDVLGAIMPFDASLGYPSHWIPYVSVASVDACCTSITMLGGEVCMGAMDIPPGRFALANDPTKALFSPFTPRTPIAPPAPRPGVFRWDELITTDAGAAKSFYTSLFGWAGFEQPMSSGEAYTLHDGKTPVAGIRKADAGATARSRWLAFVAVDDADAAAARAEKLGGKIVAAPADFPGAGRRAVIADPSGGEVAVRSVPAQ